MADQEQMPGRGDRQELGQALDDAEDEGFDQVVHGRLSSRESGGLDVSPGRACRRLTPSSLQIGYHFAKQQRQIAEIAIIAGCGVFPA
jgi:hypothetical protein